MQRTVLLSTLFAIAEVNISINRSWLPFVMVAAGQALFISLLSTQDSVQIKSRK